MINKKLSLIAIVAIVAVASTLYGISEMNPGVIRASIMQFADFTFEEKVERSGLVVVGEVTNVGVKIFPEDIMDTDENGNEYVFEHNEIPRAEVTIRILEVLKDDIGLDASRTVTFYDDINGVIGESDSQPARYISQYAIDYHVGDKGLFLIENDRGLSSLGFSSYYPIIDGETTVITQLDKLLDKPPIELTEAKIIARQVAEIQK